MGAGLSGKGQTPGQCETISLVFWATLALKARGKTISHFGGEQEKRS